MPFKLFAKKSLGQNFLVNQGVINRIVETAGVKAGEAVLEVGPGTGNLTRALAAAGARVIAVEKDQRAIEQLAGEFADQVKIVEGDILDFNPAEHGLESGQYKIVANIPYYITSHFLRVVFEHWPRPEIIVLMVQKEVAERMLAQPPHTNLLALSVQHFSEPEIVMNVSPGSFRPEPNVDSAVIKLTPKENPPELDFEIIRLGFHSKRKTLANNLAPRFGKETVIEALKSLNLNEKIRPENLSLEDWARLAVSIHN